MINITEVAFELVEDVFKNKVDKDGYPYINHLLRVSSKMKNKTEKTVALLHNIIEDTDVTAEELLELGFSQDIVDAVCILSRTQNETYAEFIDRIASSQNKSAIKVKLADLEDNMDLTRISRLTEKDIDRVEKRYKPAYEKLSLILTKLN